MNDLLEQLETNARTQPSPDGHSADRFGRPARSRRVEHARTAVESILNRCEWLSPGDRQLVRSIYADGHSIARLAPLLRTGRKSLERRVRRIVRRLQSRRFAFVAGRHRHWPETRRRIAVMTVLEGRSLREAADRLRMSLYNVRRHSDAINALYEASECP